MEKRSSSKTNRYSKFIVGTFLCILIIAATQVNAFAQCDPLLDPNCQGDPDAPLDGGVGFLVVAGVAYGLKKIRNNKGTELSEPLSEKRLF